MSVFFSVYAVNSPTASAWRSYWSLRWVNLGGVLLGVSWMMYNHWTSVGCAGKDGEWSCVRVWAKRLQMQRLKRTGGHGSHCQASRWAKADDTNPARVLDAARPRPSRRVLPQRSPVPDKRLQISRRRLPSNWSASCRQWVLVTALFCRTPTTIQLFDKVPENPDEKGGQNIYTRILFVSNFCLHRIYS